MAIGWVVDLTAADDYYKFRYGAQDKWASQTPDQKTGALTTSYNGLIDSPELNLPSTPTTEELPKLQRAQMEYALYFLVLGEGGIHRDAAIGQGLKSAGVVKEVYRDPEEIKLPVKIIGILEIYKTRSVLGIGNYFRDENEA